jgi:hypothetical protein
MSGGNTVLDQQASQHNIINRLTAAGAWQARIAGEAEIRYIRDHTSARCDSKLENCMPSEDPIRDGSLGWIPPNRQPICIQNPGCSVTIETLEPICIKA